MNKTQKGFAVVESLLIFVVIAIIVGTGYYVWHSKDQTDNSLAQANQASQSTSSAKIKKNASQPSTQATASTSSSTVKSADNKVQVTLPQGWKVSSRVDGGQKCGFVDPNAGGTCISDINYQDSSGKLDVYTKVFKSDMNIGDWYSSALGDCGDSRDMTIDAHPALECDHDGQHDVTVSNGAYVVYTFGASSTDFLSLVQSIKFL
jgi:hypothetical protein